MDKDTRRLLREAALLCEAMAKVLTRLSVAPQQAERPPVTAALPAERVAFSVDEAAEALGIGRSNLYGLIATGEIKVVRLGRRTLVPRGQIERYSR